LKVIGFDNLDKTRKLLFIKFCLFTKWNIKYFISMNGEIEEEEEESMS
jgi:hypothetical protein